LRSLFKDHQPAILDSKFIVVINLSISEQPQMFEVKGQLISKCPFGVFKSLKKPTNFFLRISALAFKKRSNRKSSVRESK
jgi:hypothetical protein